MIRIVVEGEIINDVFLVKDKEGEVKLPLLIETKNKTTHGDYLKKEVRCLAYDNHALIIEQLFRRGSNIKLEVKKVANHQKGCSPYVFLRLPQLKQWDS